MCNKFSPSIPQLSMWIMALHLHVELLLYKDIAKTALACIITIKLFTSFSLFTGKSIEKGLMYSS